MDNIGSDWLQIGIIVIAFILLFILEGPIGIGVGVAFVVGAVVIHEGAHYAAARLFGASVSLAFDGIVPNIQFHSPYEIPVWGIRLCAAAPFLIGATLAVSAIGSITSTTGVFAVVIGVGTAIPSLASAASVVKR